jgi:hypothetical protein
MKGPPSDPVHLRVVLAYLNKLLADEETVVTYLRLQRDAVRSALVRAEGAPAHSAGPPSRNGHRPPTTPPFAPTVRIGSQPASPWNSSLRGRFHLQCGVIYCFVTAGDLVLVSLQCGSRLVRRMVWRLGRGPTYACLIPGCPDLSRAPANQNTRLGTRPQSAVSPGHDRPSRVSE